MKCESPACGITARVPGPMPGFDRAAWDRRSDPPGAAREAARKGREDKGEW